MTNIVHLSNKTGECKYCTPETLLLDELQDIRDGKHEDEQCLVLWLDKKKDGFRISFNNSGMKCSEIVAVLEVMKVRCLAIMGFVDGPDNNGRKP